MLQPPIMGEEENHDLHKVVEERNKEIPELKEFKRMELKNMYTRSKSDISCIAKTWEIRTEFNSSKDETNKELMMKDKAIELLKFELGTEKDLERKLIEKDTMIEKMKTEIDCMRSTAAEMVRAMDENRRQIDELESELLRTRASEEKVFDSFVDQTAQLEQVTILSEKLRLETEAVKEEWEVSSKEENQRLREEIRMLEIGDGGRRRWSDTAKEEGDYCDEIDVLRNELRFSLEAEDRSKRAMDDLALALAEVAAEASLSKEKLTWADEQVELLRNELGNLKTLIKDREEEHENSLNQIKKENDILKNTVSRLRIEAEESLLGGVTKEIEFVKCIKKVEEEKERVEEEKAKLMKSLTTAEEKANKAREESSKFRDIMKQALNEANVAKEAAGIAKLENSQLKDHLLEKEKALLALAQETERLRINEAQLQKQVSGSSKDPKIEAKEFQQLKKTRRRGGSFSGERELKRSSSKGTLPPLLPGLLSYKHDDILVNHADKDDDMTDSIFDLIEAKPVPQLAPTNLRRSSSNISCDDDKSFNLDELVVEHVVEEKPQHLDDGNQNKKKGLLMRKFGDLWKRKSPSPSPSPTPPLTPNPRQNSNENTNLNNNNNQNQSSQNQNPNETLTLTSNQNEGAT